MLNTNSIRDIADLEELLSRPTPDAIEEIAELKGDILILGAGGKMGPTLARMAKRASDASGAARRVIAVSRFGRIEHEKVLQAVGVETIRCDMLDPIQLAALPDAPNIVFMAGMKFGSTGNAPLTWAINVELPAMVCRRFPRGRFAVFSTGNVYPLAPLASGGSLETDEPGPVGEYAMSCLGRERVFEHHSISAGIPVSIIRLSYAVEMRYGVLVDIAGKALRGESIDLDLSMGSFCAIWQADANAMALQSLTCASSPPYIVNVTGPELLSVRDFALRFGELFNKPVTVIGTESSLALISNTKKSQKLFGYPAVNIGRVVEWTANWLLRGGESFNKPTHFETTDGRF